MSTLLDHAPRFSSGAALLRHYSKVKRRMHALAPPNIRMLPSPEMMERGNPVPAVPAQKPNPTAAPDWKIYVGEVQTVQDIVPSQHHLPVRKIQMLSPGVERIAIRRAVMEYLIVIDSTPRFNHLLAIKRAVAAAFKVDMKHLLGVVRTHGIVRIRQIAICLARMFKLGSLCEIGNAFGGRDHTTVLHSFTKMLPVIEDAMASFPPMPERRPLEFDEQAERRRICTEITSRYGRVA